MSVFDKVQPYVTSEDGELFDVSFNTDDVSFVLIDLTHDEIVELISSIESQVGLLEEAYQSSTPLPSSTEEAT